MSYNNEKIIKLIFEEIENIPDRYPDYKRDIKHTLAEILRLERDHVISKTNIVQKISDQVNKVGIDLHSHNEGGVNSETD